MCEKCEAWREKFQKRIQNTKSLHEALAIIHEEIKTYTEDFTRVVCAPKRKRLKETEREMAQDATMAMNRLGMLGEELNRISTAVLDSMVEQRGPDFLQLYAEKAHSTGQFDTMFSTKNTVGKG